MKAPSLTDIKAELQHLSEKELAALCLRLARYKKENKELLFYLLFQSGNEPGFIAAIKEEITVLLSGADKGNLYNAKKTLRKVIRFMDRYIKYSGIKLTELELRLYYCRELLEMGFPVVRVKALEVLFEGQLKKISKVISGLDDELKHDYTRELEELLEHDQLKKRSFFRNIF